MVIGASSKLGTIRVGGGGHWQMKPRRMNILLEFWQLPHNVEAGECVFLGLKISNGRFGDGGIEEIRRSKGYLGRDLVVECRADDSNGSDTTGDHIAGDRYCGYGLLTKLREVIEVKETAFGLWRGDEYLGNPAGFGDGHWPDGTDERDIREEDAK